MTLEIYNPAWIDRSYELLPQYKKEVVFVQKLISKEAGYGQPSRFKQNPNSTAYGLGQFLNGTWKSTNIKRTSDGVKQISAMIIYCHNRYGSVENAVRKWNERGYYDKLRKRFQGGWY